jgi:hypothetical protein
MVNHDHNRIKARGEGKISNEVNGQLGKGAGGSRWNRGEWWCRGVSINFHLLAGGTAIDIVVNESPHGRPPIRAFNELFSAKMARMTSSSMVMMQFKNSFVQMGGHIGAVFEKEDTILKTPVVERGMHGGWRTIVKGCRGCDNNGVSKRVDRTEGGGKFIINESEEE